MTYIDIYNSMIKKADSVPVNHMQYIVKKGDNPWTINKKYGLKQGTIQNLNRGIDFNRLKIGSKLKLPLGAKPKKIYHTSKGYDYFTPTDYIMHGSMMQQSSLNPNAIGDNGKAHGILQARHNAIKDVNRIFGTKYSIKDAYDVQKAKDIYRKYLSHYGRQYYKDTGKYPTEDVYWRMWNGGPKGYLKNKTLQYVKGIKNKYKEWDKFKWDKNYRKHVASQIRTQRFRRLARGLEP